ncbi:hypothetical protein [Streptomyces sp. NPDC054834]
MWGRRRARREQEAAQAVEALAGSLRSTIDSADETHQALLEMREQLAQELAEIAALLGHRDGMPVDAIRQQTDVAARILAGVDRMSEEYGDTRALLFGKGENDLDEIMPVLEELVAHAQGMAEVGESFVGLIESMLELRERTHLLREDLIPLRERVHAAFRAAQKELDATHGAPGWFGRQATLAALGHRLTALAEGRVIPTQKRKVSDQYRDLERDIAELRDTLGTAPA